jgi:AcrR family transcriptional regulator
MQGESLPNTKKRSPARQAPESNDEQCDRIIGAAFAAFMKGGYSGTSMLEIATRAKVSKRDLYARFPSKQAVLLACISNRAGRMRLPADLPAPKNRQMLAAILEAFGATVIREVCEPAVTAMYRLAIAEAERSPDIADTLNASRFINRHALEALLIRAQATGVLGAGDAAQMMEQFFALLWGDLLISRLLGAVSSPTPDEIKRRSGNAAAAFFELHGSRDK